MSREQTSESIPRWLKGTKTEARVLERQAAIEQENATQRAALVNSLEAARADVENDEQLSQLKAAHAELVQQSAGAVAPSAARQPRTRRGNGDVFRASIAVRRRESQLGARVASAERALAIFDRQHSVSPAKNSGKPSDCGCSGFGGGRVKRVPR